MGYKTPVVAALLASTTSDGYAPMMSCMYNSNFTTESDAQTPYFVAGVLSNLVCNVWTNASTGTSTIKSRINGADGNMSLTFGAGITGRFFDNSNTDNVVNGDLVCTHLDRGGGAAMQIGQVGAFYTPNDGSLIYKVGVAGSSSFATGTGYIGFIGGLDSISDNSSATTPRITVPFTAKNFHAVSSSNGRSNTTIFDLRQNGSSTALGVTFPASTAGLQTDTANSVSISASDNINYRRVTNTGSGTFVIRQIGMELHYPANEMNLFSSDLGGTAISATTARYIVPNGSFGGTGSENPSTLPMYGSGTLSDFYYNVSASTTTAAATVDVRLGGSSTAITTTLAAGGTGTKSDTTNTATFTNGQYLNYRYLKPTGSGAATFRWFSIKVVYDIDFIPQAIWF